METAGICDCTQHEDLINSLGADILATKPSQNTINHTLVLYHSQQLLVQFSALWADNLLIILAL